MLGLPYVSGLVVRVADVLLTYPYESYLYHKSLISRILLFFNTENSALKVYLLP